MVANESNEIDLAGRPPSAGRSAAPARARLVGPTDVAVMLGLPVLGAVSWLMPERASRAFSRLCAPLYALAQVGHESLTDVRAAMDDMLGGRSLGRSLDAIIAELVAEDIHSTIQLLREYRPGGWRPRTDIVGAEHLDAALGRGHGAILWVGFQVHANLITKLALHRAGIAVSHLSHPRHGFSDSRFGMRYLNRVMTAVEDRYLAERVVLSDANPVRAMQHLRRRLADNRVVSISVRDAKRGARRMPLFDSHIGIATGAPGLAAKTGAALLPVFPLRTDENRFTVFVEPPLEIDAAAGRDAATDAALRQYGALLERYIRAYPGQWLGWLHL